MIFTYLEPREIIRSSRVSRAWHRMSYDGQLWSMLDTERLYQGIPEAALIAIIVAVGPFLRDLDLYDAQLSEHSDRGRVAEACRNVQSLSLWRSTIDRNTINSFLNSASSLVHIDLSGLEAATNRAMSIIATNCNKLQHLDISWCGNINALGLQGVVQACQDLKIMRAGKVDGWGDVEVMQQLFLHNSLECLDLTDCNSLTNESLATLIEGNAGGINYSIGRPIAPPRKLKYLNLTGCRDISDRGILALVNNIPEIKNLLLSGCRDIPDGPLTQLLPTTPVLAHLDVEELVLLTDAVLHSLSSSHCAGYLRRLNVTDCQNMGDIGMTTLVQCCKGLRALSMDNTKVSDLTLIEAAAMVRQRNPRTVLTNSVRLPSQPTVGLSLTAHDCSEVTWRGVREILSHNIEVIDSTQTAPLSRFESCPTCFPKRFSDINSSPSTSLERLPLFSSTSPHTHDSAQHVYPTQLITIFKDSYIDEHTRRVLCCDVSAAQRLERRWIEFVMVQEEMEAWGGGRIFKRRKARRAKMNLVEEMKSSIRTEVSVWKRLKARIARLMLCCE